MIKYFFSALHSLVKRYKIGGIEDGRGSHSLKLRSKFTSFTLEDNFLSHTSDTSHLV